MIETAPQYLAYFHCIAGECKHTCCAGWEIDIDPDTLARYKKDGVAHISEEGTPHFILQNERCPYLNQNNLCNLIVQHGEEYLCQICTDHPRYRNYWSNATETGVGLCCEAAARLILGQKEPMRLVITNSETGKEMAEEDFLAQLPEDEAYLFALRRDLLQQAQKIKNPMEARLTEYFIFRQLPDALYDGYLEERIQFIRRCVNDITTQWATQANQSFDALCETARAYSEDKEYDAEALAETLKLFAEGTE